MFWWGPQQVDFEAKGTPDLSLYRTSFNAQKEPVQVYVDYATSHSATEQSPLAQTKERFTTMYRCSYGSKKNGNNGVINVMSNTALVGSAPKSAPVLVGKKRKEICTDTVRSCMVWSSGNFQKAEPRLNTAFPDEFVGKANSNSSHHQQTATPSIVENELSKSENEPAIPVKPQTAPEVLPRASMCEDYGPKPLVFEPVKRSIDSTPYSNEATMAAKLNKQRNSNVLGVQDNKVLFASKFPTDAGLSRSKSEADVPRPRTTGGIVFSTW